MTLVLNLQYFDGDKDQAMALARLLADIEPAKREDVTFLFSARYDSSFDDDTIEYVSKKFNTRRFKSTTEGSGWPQGPNMLFRDSYQYCIEQLREGKMNPATGIFFMEADDVPLDREWLNKIISEWKSCGTMILGAWLKKGDAQVEHINGNCIIHKDFWKKHRDILRPKSLGWDADMANIMLPNATPSRLIWSDYGLGRSGYNEWKGCDYLFETKFYGAPDNPLYGQALKPVWLHGPKDIRGIQCVRARLFGPPLVMSKDDFGNVLNELSLNGQGIVLGVGISNQLDIINRQWNRDKLILVDPSGKNPDKKGVEFKQATSPEAAISFAKSGVQFDFVYIDLNRTYDSIKRDLNIWWALIKEGGVIGGYNYDSDPVKSAVNDFKNQLGLKLELTTHDEVKSWFFRKA